MHRTTHNELRLDFMITPTSPLSIQAKTVPGFVRALHPATIEDSAYIPASTLKGALRTAAEQVCREAGLDCCDLEHPCADRESVRKAKQAGDSAALYRALCGLCRIFGSKVLRSHLLVTDCFPAEPLEALPMRDDDPTEIVTDEPFYGRLALRNFERWQVGLLALLLARINMAEVQLGGNRSAGMGCVAMEYRSLTIIYPGLAPNADQEAALRTRLHGVGQLVGPNNRYGLIYPDMNDTADLPESAVYEAGLGFVSLSILPSEPSEETGESAEMNETSPTAEPAESANATQTHDLIDNVLTRQVLAWGNYVRTHKSTSSPSLRSGEGARG
jgi:CRISPR/Cas system CSM-associated protein Csm3 (group 7 of RAMP superfamily)